MKRSIHRSVCAALALLALTLQGCQWKQLVVHIPDFESNLIQGIQLWRGDEPASEIVTEAGRISLGDCFWANGAELIEYTMMDSQGQPIGGTWNVNVVRSEDGDGVTLRLFLTQWSEPPGWIRASSFNAAGESDLSEESVFL